MQIISRDNSLLRKARAVRDGKDTDLIYVEGLRLAGEAFNSGLPIEAVIVSEELAQKPKAKELLGLLQKVAKRYGLVSETLLGSISFTKSPQGIVLLAAHPPVGEERLDHTDTNNPLFIVLHEINNPVNVGAVLRTAEAAGVNGVIATQKTSDPFSPKSLRGAMGSAFRLPIWTGANFESAIEWCRRKGVTTIGADAAGPVNHTEVDWTSSCALVLGPESTGLTNEETRSVDASVRIPMHGEVESLNVSVAAGILLYEAVRQRQLITLTSHKTR